MKRQDKHAEGTFIWAAYTTQELENLLHQDFEASQGTLKPEDVLAIAEELNRRQTDTPTQETVQASWEAFRARIREGDRPAQEEKEVSPPSTANRPTGQPDRRKALRRGIAVAAVVCLMVCLLVVPVQGQSLLETLVSWTGNTFTFLPQGNTNEDPATLPSQADPFFSAREEFSDDETYSKVVYQQVEEAVADLTDRPVLPTWYPEGSQLTRVEENLMDDGYDLTLVFSLDGTEFTISFTFYNSKGDMDIRNYEKNEGSPEPYTIHGISHYIMGNMERNSVIWRNGTVECGIQGILTEKQLKQMIDSIYV